MTEWPKVHDWNSCVLQKGTVGSNPTLSAVVSSTSICETRQAWKGATVAEPGVRRGHTFSKRGKRVGGSGLELREVTEEDESAFRRAVIAYAQD